MERRSRPLFTRFERVGFWLRDYGVALLLIAILGALLALLLVRLSRTTDAPERLEDAMVVRFGHQETRWRQQPVVIVRTRDGDGRQLVATPNTLRNCRRGGSIRLIRSGAALFVHSQGCDQPGTAQNSPGRADNS